eukprot:7385869-Prymnesium_polylepis.2
MFFCSSLDTSPATTSTGMCERNATRVLVVESGHTRDAGNATGCWAVDRALSINSKVIHESKRGSAAAAGGRTGSARILNKDELVHRAKKGTVAAVAASGRAGVGVKVDEPITAPANQAQRVV